MSNDPVYGGFWRRFAALFLDGLAFSPLAALFIWADGRTRFSQLYFLLPNIMLSLFYSVYLVQRFGGTPGKLIMDLRITKLDGSRVGFREAALRCLPSFVFAECLAFGSIYASLHMTDIENQGLSFMARAARRTELAPQWSRACDFTNNIWTWSEFVVLLTNKKKRALHDFLAGTVVVRNRLTTALTRRQAAG